MWYTKKTRPMSRRISFKCNNCRNSFPVTSSDGTATYWKKHGIENAESCPSCDFTGRQESHSDNSGYDFSHSGLGIGGAGQHDLNAEMMDLVARGKMRFVEPVKCSWGGTRYDEACARCRRITAICNDCELCERCHE